MEGWGVERRVVEGEIGRQRMEVPLALPCLALASCIVLRFVPDSWRRTLGAGQRKRKGKNKKGKTRIESLVKF